MINFCKYDVIVVKFPFAGSLKYKARPAVVVSSDVYNQNKRNTLLILAISSKISTKLDFELEILQWQTAGLLKQSVFKSAVATITQDSVIKKLGDLSLSDQIRLEKMVQIICQN